MSNRNPPVTFHRQLPMYLQSMEPSHVLTFYVNPILNKLYWLLFSSKNTTLKLFLR